MTRMDKKIPVCWHGVREGRGYFNCTTMLNTMFDAYDVEHFGAWEKMPDVEGAVIVVHGGREITREDRLLMDIEPLKWCLIIYLGDEEASFQTERISHPNAIYWVQEPHLEKHTFPHRSILDGWSHNFHRTIPAEVERDLSWSFAGQMTHRRRWDCRTALQNIDWGGVIVESKGYTQGVSREEYARLLCRSKIVPCPSGPFSQDSARIWEALECGALPILDDLSPARTKPGFWAHVLGEFHPLPVITDWSTLRDEIDHLKTEWEDRQYEALVWWRMYKESFNQWLRIDLAKLGVK